MSETFIDFEQPTQYYVPQTIIEQNDQQISTNDLRYSRAMRIFSNFDDDVMSGLWSVFSSPVPSVLDAIDQFLKKDIVKKVKEGQIAVNADYNIMMDKDIIILPESTQSVVNVTGALLAAIDDSDNYQLEEIVCKLASSTQGMMEKVLVSYSCLRISAVRSILHALIHLDYTKNEVDLAMMDSMIDVPLKIDDLKTISFIQNHFVGSFSPRYLVELKIKDDSPYYDVLTPSKLEDFMSDIINKKMECPLKELNKFGDPLTSKTMNRLEKALRELNDKAPGVYTILFFYLYRKISSDLAALCLQMSFDDIYNNFGTRSTEVTASLVTGKKEIEIVILETDDDNNEEEAEEDSNHNENEESGQKTENMDDDEMPEDLNKQSYHAYKLQLKGLREVYAMKENQQVKFIDDEAQLVELLKAYDLFPDRANDMEEEKIIDEYEKLSGTRIRLTKSVKNKKLGKNKNVKRARNQILSEVNGLIRQEKEKLHSKIMKNNAEIATLKRELVLLRNKIGMREKILLEMETKLNSNKMGGERIKANVNDLLFSIVKVEKDYLCLGPDELRQLELLKNTYVNNLLNDLDRCSNDNSERGTQGKVYASLLTKVALFSELNRIFRLIGSASWDEKSKEMSASFPPEMLDAYDSSVLRFLGSKKVYVTEKELVNKLKKYSNAHEILTELTDNDLSDISILSSHLKPGMIFDAMRAGFKTEKKWLRAWKAFELMELLPIERAVSYYHSGVMKMAIPTTEKDLIAVYYLIHVAQKRKKNVELIPSNNPHEPWFYFCFTSGEIRFSSDQLIGRMLLAWVVGVIDRHKIWKHMHGIPCANWRECKINHLYELGFVPTLTTQRSITYKYQLVRHLTNGKKKSSKSNKARLVATMDKIKDMSSVSSSFY